MQADSSTGTRPRVLRSFDVKRLSLRMQQAQRWLAIALGFSIPISTALDNVLIGAILLLWLASGGFAQKWRVIRANPVALAALALFALCIVGLLWSIGSSADDLLFLRKYNNLLLIPILVTVFSEEQDRRRGLLAFGAALVVTLIASYGVAFGLIPTGGVITGAPDDPTVFKWRIPHNILMAFACVLFAELARTTPGRARWAYAVLAVLAIINVVLMVKGRTGYVVLAGLTLLWIASNLRWKGLVAAIVLVVAGFTVVYQVSASFHARIKEAAAEAEQWRPGVATGTSVGIRLEFYRNTFEIVKRHPLLGVGTGGFFKAYEEQVRGTQMVATHNPHNMYLLVLVQFGVLGLAALAYLFYTQWRCARQLSSRSDVVLAYALVVTFALSGLFNSMLIDHTESMFLAWMAGLLYGGLKSGSGAA
jgi:O-antigen ligase